MGESAALAAGQACNCGADRRKTAVLVSLLRRLRCKVIGSTPAKTGGGGLAHSVANGDLVCANRVAWL
jgi:hypothetical protein